MKKMGGFTIVELLIVIVVIGILAAITIVAFNGVQNRANDTAIRSDLKNIASIIEQQNALNSAYPLALTSAMDVKATKNSYGLGHSSSGANYNLLYCRDDVSYGLVAQSRSGAVYEYTSNGGAKTHPFALTSSVTTCARVGVPSSGVNGRVVQWLFQADVWQI